MLITPNENENGLNISMLSGNRTYNHITKLYPTYLLRVFGSTIKHYSPVIKPNQC